MLDKGSRNLQQQKNLIVIIADEYDSFLFDGAARLSLGRSMMYCSSVYKLAFFRCMPEILKPLFWFDGKNIGEGLDKSLDDASRAELGAGLYDFDNLAFYNSLPRELVVQDENVFKFIYIQGVLLMYKPANPDTTGISVSNAPISYDDMFPTPVMLTGGEPQERTIFDIAEDEERVRYFGTDNQ